MATNRSRQRKLYWAGAIVILFFLMLLHRPAVAEAGKEASIVTTNVGAIDLGGSITRFMLTSFRGPLICGLWWEAHEAQARHEYEQMELVTTALTKLQPHFREPWQYQAWNWAYNVAVEFDSLSDKYLFVAKGIKWLVEGERLNRANLYDPAFKTMRKVGDPTMREKVGEMFLGKMTQADEAKLYRIFLQISCTPPERRDLNQLKNNPQAMKDFKSAYPQFVRKVRDYRFVAEGAEDRLDEEIIAFLERFQELPGLYPTPKEAAQGLIKPINEFPFWPEDETGVWTRPANPGLEAQQDCFEIARKWFDFSLEPLPATDYEIQSGQVRMSQALTRTNRGKQSLIFRANSARTKCRQAMHLDEEGWTDLGQRAWSDGFDLFRKFGVQNGLEYTDDELRTLQAKAGYYAAALPHLAANRQPPPSYKEGNREEYQRLSEGFAAYMKLQGIGSGRATCNYDYWRLASENGRRDEHREARRYWYEAGRRRSDLHQALALYDESVKHWRKLFVRQEPLPLDGDIAQRFAVALSPGLPALLALGPLKTEALTPYANHQQVQESMVKLNDEYMQVAAITSAPALLKTILVAQEAGGLIGRQALTAGVQFGPAGALPIAVTPLRIEDVETIYQLGEAPFDYILGFMVRERSAERDRLVRRQRLEGTYGPQAPAPTAPLPFILPDSVISR
jgi:hypothetical protein